MKREQVVKFLVKTIEEMKKEHVADLMRANRLEELEAIAETIDLSKMDDNIHQENLELRLDEIPEDSLLETAFILCKSKSCDENIFEDWEIFQEALDSSGKSLEYHIAEIMDCFSLCCISVEELIDIAEQED